MGIKAVEVRIAGVSAILMHRFPMEPVEAIQNKSPGEQAEIFAYRRKSDGVLFIPGINIQQALIAGATYSKGKGPASLQKVAAACLLVTPEQPSLGVSEFEIDTRAVVVPSTKGRIHRHRPRLDSWQVTFTLEYDDTLLKESQVRQIVDDTGKRVGLLDFRPACKGSFGRFVVTSWTPVGGAGGGAAA
jgi:hypothetical protein